MPSTRSSARQAATASSSPNSSHSMPTLKTGSAGRKRKGSTITGLKSKRGRKGDGKQQTTIEATMPLEDHGDDSRNVEMNDAEAHSGEEASKVKAVGQEDDGVKDEEKSDEILRNTRKEEEDDAQPEDKANGYNKNNAEAVGNGKIEPENEANADRKAEIKNTDKAVENSSEREKSTPSSILEKGIIYFFFRGRVNIDEPSDVGDIARSYIVLRPMPHGSKLGDGPIGDAGTNRLLALPKKVLPASPKDRFMIFVEKANASLEEIKTAFASSNYATKTAGSRHTPAATPIGEGVYAIVSTGRESHLVYILTIPSELSEVQKDVGLQKRGSFVTSVKNPQYPSPANTNLPESPEYPQEYVGLLVSAIPSY